MTYSTLIYDTGTLPVNLTSPYLLTTDDTNVNSAYVDMDITKNVGTANNFLSDFQVEYR